MDTEAQDLIRQWQQESEDVAARIRDANRTFSERALSAPLTVTYYPHDQSLTIFFGDQRPALTEKLNDEMLVQLDPDTFEVIGVEIVDLPSFLANHPDFLALFADTFVRATGSSTTGDAINVQLARQISELVPT